MKFNELMLSIQRRDNNLDWKPPERLLALDPGETTGWAFFEKGDLRESGETDCVESMINIYNLIQEKKPEVIVMENYRVYQWKTKQHTWSKLFTPRLIGAIELICELKGIDLYKQMAQSAKGFCKNDKLKTWGFYQVGENHARDAIRHACYWLLFEGAANRTNGK